MGKPPSAMKRLVNRFFESSGSEHSEEEATNSGSDHASRNSDAHSEENDLRSQVTRGSDPYWSDLDDLQDADAPQVSEALNAQGTFHQYMSNVELHDTLLGRAQPTPMTRRLSSARRESSSSSQSFAASEPNRPLSSVLSGVERRPQDMSEPPGSLPSSSSSSKATRISEEKDGLGLRAQYLRFLEFRPDASYKLRETSRAKILEETRESLPSGTLDRRQVADLLSHTKRGALEPEVKAELEKMGIKGGKKATSRALRLYLRNALQPRDIRQMDPAFSAKPALWVRHSAIVVSLQGVRALICHNKLLLFDPDNPRVRKAAGIIAHRLKIDPNVEDVFMPFEFKALEGVLIASVMQLERDFAELEPKFKQALRPDWMGNRLTTQKLEQLRVHKQKLNHFQKQAETIQHSLQEVLDEDEDMANMYLTEKHNNPGQKRNPLDHDEVEMLLEAYLQVIDDLSNKADLLDDAIEDTEDLVGIQLDTLRNRLIMFQLMLSIISMTFAFGGLVAGLFGMNLPIPIFENAGSEWWFLGVCIFIITVIVLVSSLTISVLKLQGLYFVRT
mmetsp:Transcript_11933/g.21612  ORF Transcript_11933/g.21612 Transcript_11933/m.21612 type:complete len:560 (-) Transcript_11933:1602-3281(-)